MKIWAVIGACVVSVFLLLPTILGENSSLSHYLLGKRVSLGLDLQGGIHIVLGVDIAKALEVEADHLTTQLQNRLDDEGIAGVQVAPSADSKEIIVKLKDAQQDESLKKVLSESFYKILSLYTWENATEARLRLDPSHQENIQRMSLEQAREIIRNRVDEFGVAEPIIQIEGSDRILVQLPGVSDPGRAIQLIGKTALLEYKIVEDTMDAVQLSSLVEEVRSSVGFTNNFTSAQLKALNEALKSKLPEGTEISFEKQTDPRGGDTTITPYLLRARTALTGQALDDARVTTNATNQQPQVSLTLNKSGAEEFEVITEENVGKRMAILLDGVVISAPYIREKIPAISRGAVISLGEGNRKSLMTEARDLSLVLRSGALPAPVEILENRTVGASLGQDSIDKGKFAGMLGLIAVILFMLFYYRASGFVADLTVTINIFMVLAIMALFQATLTLPGIAGIVLTIGMAVDANVIVFERIREELRSGNKRVRAAVESGYEAAHSAILDANVTTAIAGLVLFNFGSGPIKGFAVTLLIGIACSYITAFWFSRWILEWYLDRRTVTKLSI